MSQSKWACAAVLLSVALCAPAWGISKCTAPDGSVTFQDAPCSGKGEQISVKPASGNATARTPVTTEKPAEPQKQISENKQATAPEQYPPTAPTKTQLDIEADMCLAWYKPLLRDPQGAYYTQAKKDNRVVTITIHGLNGYGGYVTKSAACEIHAGALDDGWTRKHAKRGGWGDK